MTDQPPRRNNSFGLGMMTGGGFGLVLGYIVGIIVTAVQAGRDPQPTATGTVSAPSVVTGTPPSTPPPIAVWVDAECPEPLDMTVTLAAEQGMELARRLGCGVKLRYKGDALLCAPWRQTKAVVDDYARNVEAETREKGH
jgi:hypothetical protein